MFSTWVPVVYIHFLGGRCVGCDRSRVRYHLLIWSVGRITNVWVVFSKAVTQAELNSLQSTTILAFIQPCSGYSQSRSHLYYGAYSSRACFFSVAHVTRAARMSIIYPIVRVTDPRGALRRTVYAVISSFAVMWTALVVQKVLACVYHGCNIGSDIAIADLVSQ
jgi:hypothetical protein